MMRRLPRSIRFPAGFTIEVRLCRLSGVYGSWEYSLEDNSGVIKIDSRADWPRRYRTLAHEMQHAITDYSHWLDLRARELEIEMGQTLAELKGED